MNEYIKKGSERMTANATENGKRRALKHYTKLRDDAVTCENILRLDPVLVSCAYKEASTPQTQQRQLRAIAERDALELGTILMDSMHAYLAGLARYETDDAPDSESTLSAAERNGRPAMLSEV